jgi:hypothetical protein
MINNLLDFGKQLQKLKKALRTIVHSTFADVESISRVF